MIVFIIAFAISLGPIPYLYSAEVFRQNSRSSAMSVAIVVNWLSNLITTVGFPFLQNYIHQYVFLIYVVFMLGALVIVVKKVKLSLIHISVEL